jgi:hypothetical protein
VAVPVVILLHGKIGGLGAFGDLVDLARRAAKEIGDLRGVAQESAGRAAPVSPSPEVGPLTP